MSGFLLSRSLRRSLTSIARSRAFSSAPSPSVFSSTTSVSSSSSSSSSSAAATTTTSRRTLSRHLSRHLSRARSVRFTSRNAFQNRLSIAGVRGFATGIPSQDGEQQTAITQQNATDSASAVLEAADGTLLEPLTWTYPQDLLLHLMSYCHDTLSLQWASVIVFATISLRCITLPLTIKTMRGTSRLAILKPKVEALVARQKEDPNYDQVKGAAELSNLYKNAGVHPLVTMAMPLIQMPMFMSFFFATRKLSDYYPDAATQGALWFTDLSAPDPLYILPVLAGASFMMTVKIGQDGMPPPDPNGPMKHMKTVMYGLGLMTVPLATTFPAATVFYWVLNNTISMTQTTVLNMPAVKKSLGILPAPPAADAPIGVGVTPTSFVSVPPPTSSAKGTGVEDVTVAATATENPKHARSRRKKRRRKVVNKDE